jgi:hypothetical protein
LLVVVEEVPVTLAVAVLVDIEVHLIFLWVLEVIL